MNSFLPLPTCCAFDNDKSDVFSANCVFSPANGGAQTHRDKESKKKLNFNETETLE